MQVTVISKPWNSELLSYSISCKYSIEEISPSLFETWYNCIIPIPLSESNPPAKKKFVGFFCVSLLLSELLSFFWISYRGQIQLTSKFSVG